MGEPDWLKMLEDFFMGIGERSKELFLLPRKGAGDDIPKELAPM